MVFYTFVIGAIIALIIVSAVMEADTLPVVLGLSLSCIMLGMAAIDDLSVRKSNHKGYEIETIYKVKNGKKIGVTYHVKEKKS
jgi:hypothetical protein